MEFNFKKKSNKSVKEANFNFDDSGIDAEAKDKRMF